MTDDLVARLRAQGSRVAIAAAARIEALEAEKAELTAHNDSMDDRNALLRKRIQVLEERNREHEERYTALEAMVDHYKARVAALTGGPDAQEK